MKDNDRSTNPGIDPNPFTDGRRFIVFWREREKEHSSAPLTLGESRAFAQSLIDNGLKVLSVRNASSR